MNINLCFVSMSEHIHTNNRNPKAKHNQQQQQQQPNYNNSAALDLRNEHTLAMTDKQYNKKTF